MFASIQQFFFESFFVLKINDNILRKNSKLKKKIIHFTKYFEIFSKIILKFNSNDDFQHVFRDFFDLSVMTASVFFKFEKSVLKSLQAFEKTREIIFNLMINSKSDIFLLKNCCSNL